jgi:hypothetical protein
MTNTNKRLLSILNEKDVENFYRQYLTKKFGDIVFSSPFGCDGYGESEKHKIKIISEFKHLLDLTSKVNQVKILCQVLYYIKKFEVSGKILPSVILIGNRNECFVIHTNEIFNYLGMDFDWSIAPSNAHTNVELVTIMIEDDKINPHVFNIKDIANCVDKIKDLTDGVKRYIPITPHNVTEVFKHFEEKVIGKNNLDTNQMANLFVQLLVNPDENYLHPVTRRKTVVTKAFNEVNLKSREVFESFFSHFSREYTPQQREHLTAVVDRLVQDVTRRKQGEFFTPSLWADKANEFISKVFGDDWRDDYKVWDPAWGTGNLTRDLKFKNLFASTLNYSDIQTADQMGYNPDGTKFQFDFLNDPFNYLPQKLKDSMNNKEPMIIYYNPPYATSSEMKQGKSKKGVGVTQINKEMNIEKLDRSASQLYAQFFYRASKIDNTHICMFSKPTFMTGQVYSEFRKKVLSNFEFKGGFVMDAKDFEGVKSWPLTFSIWKKTDKKIEQNSFEFEIIKKGELGELETIGTKKFYNTDGQKPLNRWLKDSVKSIKTFDAPQLSSALMVKPKGYGKLTKDAFGYLIASKNIPESNSTMNAILSSAFSGKNGISIRKENFTKVVAHFAARKLIYSNWINEKDEYLAPNENHESYKEFIDDSVILSLFNNSSEQSSLRQIVYKELTYDIKNEFFWMSKNEIRELANQNNYTELYNDARTDSDRYVYTLLFGEENIYSQLSDEAKDVLNSATNLVRLSFGMRRNFADDTNHLNSWDAGYAQLKLLWKEYYPEQFKEFRAKYKVLEDKMRPMVYELGFLIK